MHEHLKSTKSKLNMKGKKPKEFHIFVGTQYEQKI